MLPKSVTFSIPRDHPHAGRLLKIFDTLTTSRTMPSGLRIESGIEDEEAVSFVIAELREVLMETGVDLNDVLEKALNRKPATEEITGILKNPVLLAGLLTGLFDNNKDFAAFDAEMKEASDA